MITVRQIERFWQEGAWQRIVRLCLETRPEESPRLSLALGREVSAAALAFIRLDELSQTHAPFCSRMLRAILAAQEADGGWGDPLTTALCLKALMCSHGSGEAIERGLGYLANLQKTEGIWPKIPVRRLSADAFVSAFILFKLADDPRFQQAVGLDSALGWFQQHQNELDLETARLWKTISLRAAGRKLAGSSLWS
jgi:hypothetical protein